MSERAIWLQLLMRSRRKMLACVSPLISGETSPLPENDVQTLCISELIDRMEALETRIQELEGE